MIAVPGCIVMTMSRFGVPAPGYKTQFLIVPTVLLIRGLSPMEVPPNELIVLIKNVVLEIPLICRLLNSP